MEAVSKENNWRKGDERGLLSSRSSTHIQLFKLGSYSGNLSVSPMQKLVAATSIAILILSLYPALPIASSTRSRASLKLSIEDN